MGKRFGYGSESLKYTSTLKRNIKKLPQNQQHEKPVPLDIRTQDEQK